MRIKKITHQHRRDITAIFVCEHCKLETEGTGYDDTFWHQKIVPEMKCCGCNKTAPDTFEPRSPKYPDDQRV
mgnify:CR=1 FL=1|tara:strand:- start:516 stop:731 length:216 start_codon:yes stop_codon:yes gene_type:complete